MLNKTKHSVEISQKEPLSNHPGKISRT